MRTTRSVMVRYLLTLAAALALLTATARAQLVADGQTNVLSGVTNNLSSGLTIGVSGGNSMLVLTNRANVYVDVYGPVSLGYSPSASNNQIVVGGVESKLLAQRGVIVGNQGSGNSALVTAGGLVSGIFGVYVGFDGYLGSAPMSQGNRITVTGTNSTWNVGGNLYVSGSSGAILVAAGGKFNCKWSGTGGYAYIGHLVGSDSNQVVITGSNSVFTADDPVWVGNSGSYNSVIVTNSGSLRSSGMVVGYEAGSSNNQVTVNNGKISVTNFSGATLDVRRGSLIFSGGTIQASILLLTNNSGYFSHYGGALAASVINVSNGRPFLVGDGTNLATISLTGKATNLNSFSDGLLIASNATLTGTGTINGSVTNCGTIFLTNADQMFFTGPLVNKGVIIAVTGTPRFGSTFTNLGTLITTASINVANVSVSGDDIVLQFYSVSNYLHEVQASTNVSSGLWQSLTNGLLGTGSPITFTDPGGATNGNRTYRVLLH